MKILFALYVINLLNNVICFPEGRMYSNRELLEIKLNQLFAGGLIKTHGSDNTVESYLAAHPKCCGVGFNLEFFLFDFTFLNPVVTIDYEMSDYEREKHDLKTTHHIRISFQDACGKQYRQSGEYYTPKNNTRP